MSTCEWWIPAATSAVTLVLHSLLLLTLYIMLSRKIARHSCEQQVSSSPPAQSWQPPTSAAPGEGEQRLTYAGSSETSSETSEDSDSSTSCPQGSCSGKNLNYTCLVFPEEGCRPQLNKDYQNVKIGADYINVDPKNKKVDFWPCSSPGASKPVEYTEVKL